MSRIEVTNSVTNDRNPRPTKRKARRTRSPHPGVVLLPPKGAHVTWRAKYTDPDTSKEVRVRIDPLAVGNAEARRLWAVQLARTLAKRGMELESGAPRATGAALETAVGRYYDAHATLRPQTLVSYRAATDKLLAWARDTGLTSADDLTRAKLMDFRERLIAEPKRAAAPNGKRGARRVTRERRSPYSVNRELRSVRVVLGYLAELDLLPRVREGDLRRALKKLPTTTDEASFLRPPQIAAVLEAALAHDAETYAETRAEHGGEGERGTTPRYDAVAPLVAVLLLTGMRLGEALALTWSQVDLDAPDHDGRPVGDIRLTGATKTKRARIIDLAVSPILRELLLALRKVNARGPVFRVSYNAAGAIAKRLRRRFDAPEEFTWQALRSTCGTYLTNAPGIFGAASAYRSARQLGHSVAVAERHYLGLIRLPPTAATLEAAMGVSEQLQRVIDAVDSCENNFRNRRRLISR